MTSGPTAALRRYEPDDWMPIRQFLIDTYVAYGRPCNWLIDRWNFCQYFVLPVHTYYNAQYFSVPTLTEPPIRNELEYWERTVFVWESSSGEIVGVVNTENEEAGEAWIQSHPAWHHLFPEMIDVIEKHLTNWVDGLGYVKIYADSDIGLDAILSERGYTQLEGEATQHSVFEFGDLPKVKLPDGFHVVSVAEEDDVDKRRIAYSRAFGNRRNPSDWAPASVFREMERAPDFRPELSLCLVAPNGDYAAMTVIWLDEANRYANFEPVATHPDYQRQGLGTALLYEGFRRMADHGAVRSYMDAGNPFYRKVGFVPMPFGYCPWIKYLRR